MMKYIGLFFLLLAGCKKEACLNKGGAVVMVVRAAAPFHEIRLHDNIDLVLTQDTVERLTVTAPQGIEPNLTTTITNGILTIKNEALCAGLRNAAEKLTAYVHLKKLDKLLYAGSGNVTSTNTLAADNITFYSETGAGNVEVWLNATQTFSYIMDENADFIFHGSSAVCWTFTGARGTIDFSDFEVGKMIIEYGGLRDAHINVTHELNSILYYKGNVYYKGTPQLTKDETHSTGRLIHVF